MRISDWSSDVCSSDLGQRDRAEQQHRDPEHRHGDAAAGRNADQPGAHAVAPGRRTFGVPVPLAATHCLPSLPSASASLRATALALSAGSPITCTALPSRNATLPAVTTASRSEEHTSELQSLMRISYAVFCLKKKNMN